jgi:hypothetical protein
MHTLDLAHANLAHANIAQAEITPANFTPADFTPAHIAHRDSAGLETAAPRTGELVFAPHIPHVVFVPLGDDLWRVTRPDGELLGYIDQFRVREGIRYRAKLFALRSQKFMVMGEFWSMDDAAQCFRAN